ncbi:MAG TPA: alkaline phosphatase family protein [Steroidobacteraceae bacterium]
MKTLTQLAVAGVLAGALTGMAVAHEGPVPRGIAHLDHMFVIMMENHGFTQIIGNPYAPYTNRLAQRANLATNYYAIAHPSLTNYLEIVAGSNFGILDDNSPNWHNTNCQPNIAAGVPNLESDTSLICPIWGSGIDAATPALDFSNETSDPSLNPNLAVVEVDGTVSFPSISVQGMSIADQLALAHGTWKSYEEDLPDTGADGVNSADGFFSNLNEPATVGVPNASLVGLYAVKHNPFAYFQSTESQEGLANMVGFDGPGGLLDDLRRGNVPNFSFIAPNQCHDQHGRGNAGSSCEYDANDVGTQQGLNPALILAGDAELKLLVDAITHSPAWQDGNNAIAIVWDEDDYSIYPTTNRVPLIVVSNDRDAQGRQSSQFYTHFSLLKTLEAGFGLPCLNNACDANVNVLSDLFPSRGRD